VTLNQQMMLIINKGWAFFSFLHEGIISPGEKVEFVSDRMSYIN
jgi:hypothetical protein